MSNLISNIIKIINDKNFPYYLKRWKMASWSIQEILKNYSIIMTYINIIKDNKSFIKFKTLISVLA